MAQLGDGPFSLVFPCFLGQMDFTHISTADPQAEGLRRLAWQCKWGSMAERNNGSTWALIFCVCRDIYFSL